MMNYQTQSKQMVVDALLKVVKAAPTSQIQAPYFYPVRTQPHTISLQEFNTWLNYVNSILDISYSHTGFNNIQVAKLKVLHITSQNNMTYMDMIVQIKDVILNLAQEILQYP